MGCCVSNSAIMYAQAATEAERVQMRHEAQPQTVAAPSKPQDAAARQHEASCHAATQLVDLAIVGAIDDAVAAHRTLTAHKASAASAWATEQAAKAEAASARLEEPVDTEEVVQLAASEKGFPVDECPAVMPDLSQHHTLAAQVLRENPGIYKQLRTLVTSSGVPFARCVKTTFDHAGHPKLIMVGAVAGDAECYSTFAPFFDRLIEARHWGVSAAAPSDLNHSRVKHCGTLDPEGSYIRNVRVRSARSICGFRFPPACSLEERREVELVLVRALHKAGLGGSYTPMPGSNSAGRLSAAGLSAALDQSEGTLASLARRGYLFGQPRSPVLTTSGMARDWPDARGVFCTNMDLGQNSAALVCWVNEEDHLRLMALSAGANIRHVFEVFSKAVHAVEAALGDNTDKEGMAGAGFAHTKQHGYLLTCPSNIGTGLRVSVNMLLPALPQQLRFRQLIAALALKADPRPTQHAPASPGIEAPSSRIWDVSNLRRLGVTEVDLTNSLIAGIETLVKLEKMLALAEPPASTAAANLIGQIIDNESAMGLQ